MVSKDTANAMLAGGGEGDFLVRKSDAPGVESYFISVVYKGKPVHKVLIRARNTDAWNPHDKDGVTGDNWMLNSVDTGEKTLSGVIDKHRKRQPKWKLPLAKGVVCQKTHLQAAINKGRIELVSALIEAGAATNTSDVTTAVKISNDSLVKARNHERLQAILDAEADAGARTELLTRAAEEAASSAAGDSREGVANYGQDGSVYQGDIVGGKRHGHGTVVFADGGRYTGTFVHGQRTGQATDRCTCKACIKSVCTLFQSGASNNLTMNASSSRMNGRYKNGDIFTGSYLNGSRVHGKFEDHSGDDSGNVYEGFFKKGLYHGQGTFNYYWGDIYEGWWAKGKRHGKGKITWNNDHFSGDSGVVEWTNGASADADKAFEKCNGALARLVIDGAKRTGALLGSSLHLAAEGGNTNLVESLLEARADSNALNADGNGALHLAVYGGFHNCAEVLIKAKANVTTAAKDLETPLHFVGAAPFLWVFSSFLSVRFLGC